MQTKPSSWMSSWCSISSKRSKKPSKWIRYQLKSLLSAMRYHLPLRSSKKMFRQSRWKPPSLPIDARSWSSRSQRTKNCWVYSKSLFKLMRSGSKSRNTTWHCKSWRNQRRVFVSSCTRFLCRSSVNWLKSKKLFSNSCIQLGSGPRRITSVPSFMRSCSWKLMKSSNTTCSR